LTKVSSKQKLAQGTLHIHWFLLSNQGKLFKNTTQGMLCFFKEFTLIVHCNLCLKNINIFFIILTQFCSKNVLSDMGLKGHSLMTSSGVSHLKLLAVYFGA